MSKAKTDLLERIHQLLAKAMLSRLEDEEAPADAREWAVIVKFLKDNNIDAIPSTGDEADDVFAKLMERAQASVSKHQ